MDIETNQTLEYKIVHRPKALDYSDVLILPSGPTEHTTRNIHLDKLAIARETVWNKNIQLEVPVMAANMFHIGSLEMGEALSKQRCNTALCKNLPTPELKTFLENWPHSKVMQIISHLWISAGMDNTSHEHLQENIKYLRQLDPDYIPRVVLDVANGYQTAFWEIISQVRTEYPNAVIMAGNIATPEIVPELIAHGADIVKVGLGNGSLCLTRYMTGVGVPQLTAVMQCVEAADNVGGLVCADGGCSCPGDIVKALVAGADMVMVGGMFAGYKETRGDLIRTDDGVFKRVYGMSSREAMQEISGHVPSYRAPEGKQALVPYRGPVEDFIESHVIGGLRGAMTLTNCDSISELPIKAKFIRVMRQLNNVFGPPA